MADSSEPLAKFLISINENFPHSIWLHAFGNPASNEPGRGARRLLRVLAKASPEDYILSHIRVTKEEGLQVGKGQGQEEHGSDLTLE